MSISPPTATSDNPTAAAATTNSDDSTTTVIHLTYWCHECDMSVLLYPPPPVSSPLPLICPHCRNDFLEQMENPTATLHTNTVGNASPDDDDDLLLDTSYYYRLINSLMTATAPTAAPTTHTNPASKSAIDSLQRITVDSAFLHKDPTVVCPVCKDQFSIGAEAKLLPCTHTYHADCIVPWLEINNSCPVCRFELPREDVAAAKHEVAAGEGGDDGLMGARLDELLQDDQDLFGFTSILRNVVRRQQQNADDSEEHNRNVENWNRRVVWDNEVLFSPTQIGEDGSGGRRDHVERANSVETVTSWPAWPVDAGASGSGSGDVEMGNGRGASEGDGVRS